MELCGRAVEQWLRHKMQVPPKSLGSFSSAHSSWGRC